MGYRHDLDNAIQTKAEFSNALSVMDRIGGWEGNEERRNEVGVEFASCMWICTKAVVCDGRTPDLERENLLKRKLDSIIHAVELGV